MLRDGKTGADILKAAKSDDKLASLLADDAAAWPARMRSSSENGDFHLERPTLALPLPDNAAPSLRSLRLQFDPNTGELLLADPQGKAPVLLSKIQSAAPLLFHMLGAIAQFETEIRAERQRDGIENAKARGVPFGRRKALTLVEELSLRTRRVQPMVRELSDMSSRMARLQQRLAVQLAGLRLANAVGAFDVTGGSR